MIRVFNQYVSSKGLLCAVCECLLTVLALLCGGRMRFWTSPAEFETFRRMPEFGLQVLIEAPDRRRGADHDAAHSAELTKVSLRTL